MMTRASKRLLKEQLDIDIEMATTPGYPCDCDGICPFTDALYVDKAFCEKHCGLTRHEEDNAYAMIIKRRTETC